MHPVATLLTLICFGLAVAAHFHGPSHSPRYLLALLILTFPTLLVALLAFLVDILLFVPHVAWGGWIVLAATILVVASGVVTCAMVSPLTKKSMGIARLDVASAAQGTPLEVRNKDGSVKATAQPLPFDDPKKTKRTAKG